MGHGVTSGCDSEGLVPRWSWERNLLRLLVRGAGTKGRGPPSKHMTATPIHAAIPPVLDCIIAPAMKSPSDFSPTLPHLTH
jgi:hypothetical protein